MCQFTTTMAYGLWLIGIYNSGAVKLSEKHENNELYLTQDEISRIRKRKRGRNM